MVIENTSHVISDKTIKDNQILVSFIIPVYNTPAELLSACITSIKKSQLKFPYEIVVIDDGSKTNIEKVIQSLNYGSELRFYRTENGGVSKARNEGIHHAVGKWLTFVDPDDLVTFDPRINQLLNDSKDDIIFFPYARISDRDHIVKDYRIHDLIPKAGLSSTVLVESLLRVSQDVVTIDGFYLGTPWGKLFQASFLREHKLLFDVTLRKRQDALFCAQCYQAMTSYNLIERNEAHYAYRIDHEGSITKKYNQQLKTIYRYLFEKMATLGNSLTPAVNSSALQLYCYDLTKELINLDFCNVNNPHSYHERKKDFISYREDPFFSTYYVKTALTNVHVWKRILYTLIRTKQFWLLNGIFLLRKAMILVKKRNKPLN